MPDWLLPPHSHNKKYIVYEILNYRCSELDGNNLWNLQNHKMKSASQFTKKIIFFPNLALLGGEKQYYCNCSNIFYARFIFFLITNQ